MADNIGDQKKRQISRKKPQDHIITTKNTNTKETPTKEKEIHWTSQPWVLKERKKILLKNSWWVWTVHLTQLNMLVFHLFNNSK